MDVISKEGPLFLQGVKFGKKIWRKSWLILFEPSPAGIGRMELYDMRDGGGRFGMGFAVTKPAGLKKMDKRVIRLTDCLSITPAPGESCPTDCSAFFLNTTSSTYTIAAPTQENWVSVLCQLAFQKTQGNEDARRGQKDKHTPLADNELYSTWGTGQFQVTVQSTEASQRCRMSGSYLLSAEKEAICLLDLKTGQAIYHWPYRLLRRFGQVKGGILIESGRRCHTGEGQFIFLSKQGSQIHRAIEEAIMHQSVQELLAQATALPKEFASQPPSPKSQAKDRPQVKKVPPLNVNQDRPRPALQCKHGQPIHKVIEEALAHQSLQELLPPSTPLPPPPPSPKPKTQGKDKPKVNKHLPVNKERPCPPALPVHRLINRPHDYQNVQRPLASSKPPQQAPPLPPPLPKTRPRDKLSAPAPSVHQKRPSPVISRRHISLPDPPPCVKSPVKSPDDVLYSVIFPQPMPRKNISLPRVPTPPSLPQLFAAHANDSPDTNVLVQKEKSDEEAPYTNWTAKTPDIEDLYSKVNFAAKRKNRQTEEQPNADHQRSEIPGDFKQTLSGILSKELSKNPHACPPRSHGGSCDQIDTLDEQMTH